MSLFSASPPTTGGGVEHDPNRTALDQYGQSLPAPNGGVILGYIEPGNPNKIVDGPTDTYLVRLDNGKIEIRGVPGSVETVDPTPPPRTRQSIPAFPGDRRPDAPTVPDPEVVAERTAYVRALAWREGWSDGQVNAFLSGFSRPLADAVRAALAETPQYGPDDAPDFDD